MMMKKWISILVLSLVVGAMFGCSGGDSSQSAEDMKPVTPSANDAGKDGASKPTSGVKAMKGDVD